MDVTSPAPRIGASKAHARAWPKLSLDEWRTTRESLHRFSQIVGKVKLGLAPPRNHWWQVALYVDGRGLTTGLVPVGDRALQIDFDFVDHVLRVRSCDEAERAIPLGGHSVAAMHHDLLGALHELGWETEIWPVPVEVADRTPLDEDTEHGAYDPDAAHRFWRALVSIEGVMTRFQSTFVGKASPVHFFWGSFDLATTRFSGRPAPEHPGGPNVARSVMVEAYSHEVSSCGFWPGGEFFEEPIFYSYAYPEPAGFERARVQPAAAKYDHELREFVLPYEAVRRSADPEHELLRFFQTTYDAAARLGGWDRAALERPIGGGSRSSA